MSAGGSALVARFLLRDPFGNLHFLAASEGANRAVELQLTGANGFAHSLGNLQATEPFPAFWGERDETLAKIRAAIDSSVESISSEEITPCSEVTS